MKLKFRERKRLLSVLLAIAITVTSVLSVVGINIVINGLTKTSEASHEHI